MIKSTSQTMPTPKKYFILSVVLLPILFQYATPLPGFTVGDAFMVLAWVLMLLFTRKLSIKKSLLFCLAYIILLSLACYIEGTLTKSTTSLRYIFYLLIMLYFPSVENHRDYIYKVIDLVGICVMIILYIQYVAFYAMGIIVPGVLTFLPLTDTALTDYVGSFSSAGRCMSVFAEPSHYAIFILIFIAYRLFLYEGLSLKHLLLPVFASVSVVLCSSFTGIIMMAAVWALKVFTVMRSRNLSIIYVITTVLVFGIMFYLITNTALGSYIVDSEVYKRQSLGRFAGYEYMANSSNKSTSSLFFGNGMNDIGEIAYLPGWPRLFFYYGILGSLIYVISFLFCIRWKTFSLVLMIIIAGLMVGTEMNFGPLIMPYMLMVITSDKSLILRKIDA